MKRLLLANLAVLLLASCAAKKPQVIACRAVYLKANSDKPQQRGKWHQGYSECEVLMLGLAVANTPTPDSRKQVEFKNASDDELLNLGWFYRRMRKELAPSVEDELNKERRL